MFTGKEDFKKAYLSKFAEIQGKTLDEGTKWEKYQTLVFLIKNWVGDNWAETNNRYAQNRQKQVFYFSMEFLIGKLLAYYLLNLGIKETVEAGLADLGIELEELVTVEKDAGLGNGGLGRLAACFLDSLAFLGMAGHGNGIRYKYGLFQQKTVNGYQVELPDSWLNHGYPWEIKKPDKSVVVRFKGEVEVQSIDGKLVFQHKNYEPVLAVPYDLPVISYDNLNNINTLRLWSAEPVLEEFDLASFHRGEYSKAVSYRSEVEAISYILYPEDSSRAGQELRLKQEYFFAAAGLGSIVRRYKRKGGSLKEFSKRIAIHINDTHPALCVPELMRILMDEEGLGWEEAWNITVNSISYTNHTIMPEALEKWSIDIVKYLLPRIYMIIEEIDARFKAKVGKRYPGNQQILKETAILWDGRVRMANLAVIGSHSVNGVSALHSDILKNSLFKDFHSIYPYKLNNKTNGVSHRRFLLNANPGLSGLITAAIGQDWIYDGAKLEGLLPFQQDQAFLRELGKVKRANKEALSNLVRERMGRKIDPDAVFDVQVKRIHAYKRQLLNALRIMDFYNRLKEDPYLDLPPHVFIFGGKAAPGYQYAKTIIKLINSIAYKVNSDESLQGKLQVIFLDNFNVTLAEKIYPAADISQQISAASREASGTGNMKFMMNGAITLGTLDGANVEISKLVGEGNIAIFGLNAEQVMSFYQKGGYHSWDEYHRQPRIKRVLDQLLTNFFDEGEGDFRVIFDSLLRDNDEFFVLRDFGDYLDAWHKLCRLYQEPAKWNEKSLVNIAKSGFFASDRAIKQYGKSIWQLP
ncbi:MAG: glycogen/starch/alpha-glucan phosphorylase [Bacillota bacterium]